MMNLGRTQAAATGAAIIAASSISFNLHNSERTLPFLRSSPVTFSDSLEQSAAGSDTTTLPRKETYERLMRVSGALQTLSEPSAPQTASSTDEKSADQIGVLGTNTEELVNWSGTKSVECAHVYRPSSVKDVERLVAAATLSSMFGSSQKLRPTGTGLSPNGISFEKEGCISLSNLDGVLNIDLGDAARYVCMQN
jgi:hypothetical protein